MDAEEKRIQKILKGIDPEDDWAAMERWGKYLRKALKFPFRAKVAEPQEGGPLRTGDKIVVMRILDVDDRYGVIVDVQTPRENHGFPICDLSAQNSADPSFGGEVIDRKLRAYRMVRDYVVWFANR